MRVTGNVHCKAVPFFSPNQGCDWCEMRGRVGLEKREGRGKVPRGCASHTYRLPRTRVVRWLGERKRTALQSAGNENKLKWFLLYF